MTRCAPDARTGVGKWHFIAGGPVRFASQLDRGGAYFAADDVFVYCRAAETGKLVWKISGCAARRTYGGQSPLTGTHGIRVKPHSEKDVGSGFPLVPDSAGQWFQAIRRQATAALRIIGNCESRLPARYRWWSRQGSNLRPSHCERDALPTELRPQPSPAKLARFFSRPHRQMSTSFAGNPAHWRGIGHQRIAKWPGRLNGGKLNLPTCAGMFADNDDGHEPRPRGVIESGMRRSHSSSRGRNPLAPVAVIKITARWP